jgi:uncharacterized protein
MRISIRVKTKAKLEKVEEVSKGRYRVAVRAVPEKGKANERVLELMSDYLDVPKSRLEIVGGQTSTQKIMEVSGGASYTGPGPG